MANNGVNLASLFQAVTQSLAENRQSLNQADTYNQDHGDNMVQTFETITQALQEKQGKPDSAALNYAAKQLLKNTSSGSGKLYAEGLSQAATQFKGQQIDPQAALQLLQTLIGGGQTAAQPAQANASGDVLGSLLGGLLGGTENTSQPTSSQTGGDALGSLLGGLLGGTENTSQSTSSQGSGDALGSLVGSLLGGTQTASQDNSGFGLDDLVNAGLTFMQAKQSGGSNMEAAIKAFLAVSGMGGTSDRTQSTELVVRSFLQALGGMKS